MLATRRAALTAATDDPVEELRLAVVAGKVTQKNAAEMVTKAATALLVKERARQVGADLERTFIVTFRAAVAAEAESMLISLRPAWDDAAAALVVATEAFGDANPDAILNAGPRATACGPSGTPPCKPSPPSGESESPSVSVAAGARCSTRAGTSPGPRMPPSWPELKGS